MKQRSTTTTAGRGLVSKPVGLSRKLPSPVLTSSSAKGRGRGREREAEDKSLASQTEFHTWERGDALDSDSDSDSDAEASSASAQRNAAEAKAKAKAKGAYEGNVLGRKVQDKAPIVASSDTDSEGAEEENDKDEEEEEDAEQRTAPKLALKSLLSQEEIEERASVFREKIKRVRSALRATVFDFEALKNALNGIEDTAKEKEKDEESAGEKSQGKERRKERERETRVETLQRKLDEKQSEGANDAHQDQAVERPAVFVDDEKTREDAVISSDTSLAGTERRLESISLADDVREQRAIDEQTARSANQESDSLLSSRSERKVSAVKAKYQALLALSEREANQLHTRSKDADLDFELIRITKVPKERLFLKESGQEAKTEKGAEPKSDRRTERTEREGETPRFGIGFDLRSLPSEEQDNDESIELSSKSGLSSIAEEQPGYADKHFNVFRSSSASNTPRNISSQSQAMRAFSMPNLGPIMIASNAFSSAASTSLGIARSTAISQPVPSLRFNVPQEAKTRIFANKPNDCKDTESSHAHSLSQLEQRILGLSAATPRQKTLSQAFPGSMPSPFDANDFQQFDAFKTENHLS